MSICHVIKYLIKDQYCKQWQVVNVLANKYSYEGLQLHSLLNLLNIWYDIYVSAVSLFTKSS